MYKELKLELINKLLKGDSISASTALVHKGSENYVYINNKELDYSDEFREMLVEWMIDSYRDYLLGQNQMNDFEIEFKLLDNELIFSTTFYGPYEDEYEAVYFELYEMEKIYFLKEKVDCDDFEYENFDFDFDYDEQGFNTLNISYNCDDKYVDVELTEEQLGIIKSVIEDFIIDNVPYLDVDNAVEQNYSVYCRNSTQEALVYSVNAGPVIESFDDFN